LSLPEERQAGKNTTGAKDNPKQISLLKRMKSPSYGVAPGGRFLRINPESTTRLGRRNEA
jgi:hypothetical protein